eukprot:Pgem_evm1s11167
MVEADFIKIAAILDQCVKLCLKIQEKSGKPLKAFVACLGEEKESIDAIANTVEEIATKFEMPGFDIKTMKYGPN